MAVHDKYEKENVKFILWLFDNQEHYNTIIKPDLLEALDSQRDLDRARQTSRRRRSKLRNHVRATIRQWLRAIVAERSKTYLIELSDLSFTGSTSREADALLQKRKRNSASARPRAKHMPISGFKKLVKILFESEKPKDIPVHTFFVLNWNLVSREEYVIGTKIDLVSFRRPPF